MQTKHGAVVQVIIKTYPNIHLELGLVREVVQPILCQHSDSAMVHIHNQ